MSTISLSNSPSEPLSKRPEAVENWRGLGTQAAQLSSWPADGFLLPVTHFPAFRRLQKFLESFDKSPSRQSGPTTFYSAVSDFVVGIIPIAHQVTQTHWPSLCPAADVMSEGSDALPHRQPGWDPLAHSGLSACRTMSHPHHPQRRCL